MAKTKKKSRFVGSCGIYVVVKDEEGSLHLLVQRRSKQVSEPETICGPGGIVERPLCLDDAGEFNFELGARRTAHKELHEETGIVLNPDCELKTLPIGPGTYWGEELHRNYCVELELFPDVPGPDKGSIREVIAGGLEGIGRAAGDGYHAWVDVAELLERPDLMKGCKVPLEHLLVKDPANAQENNTAAGRRRNDDNLFPEMLWDRWQRAANERDRRATCADSGGASSFSSAPADLSTSPAPVYKPSAEYMACWRQELRREERRQNHRRLSNDWDEHHNRRRRSPSPPPSPPRPQQRAPAPADPRHPGVLDPAIYIGRMNPLWSRPSHTQLQQPQERPPYGLHNVQAEENEE